VEAEAERGDAWKAAAEAEAEHAAALEETLVAETKAAHRRGLKTGAALGAAATVVIVLAVLL
jgi:hypothetical protein